MRILGLLTAALAFLFWPQDRASAQESQLFERFGMRLALAPYPGENPHGNQIAVITTVLPSSPAAYSGFRENMVLQRGEGFEFRNLRRDATVASAEKAFLEALERTGYIYGYTVPLSSFGDLRANPNNNVPFLLPKLDVERRLGFRLLPGNIVAEVLNPSPAATAGFQPGDVVRARGRMASLPSEHTLGALMDDIAKGIRQNRATLRLLAVRDGTTYQIEMPHP